MIVEKSRHKAASRRVKAVVIYCCSTLWLKSYKNIRDILYYASILSYTASKKNSNARTKSTVILRWNKKEKPHAESRRRRQKKMQKKLSQKH